MNVAAPMKPGRLGLRDSCESVQEAPQDCLQLLVWGATSDASSACTASPPVGGVSKGLEGSRQTREPLPATWQTHFCRPHDPAVLLLLAWA